MQALAGGINVAISIDASKSQSNTSSQTDTARGSSVKAGGNVAIIATGGGKGSNLTILGSRADAGQSALLLAAKNAASQHSTNSNSSGSIV